MPEYAVQVGLFGGEGELVGMHVVAAHTRVLEDGSEVFVGEHLRWNRGRLPRKLTAPRPSAPAEGQPGLFDAPAQLELLDDPADQ